MSERLGHAVAIRDEDERGSNRSGNPHVQDIIDARVSRRRFLGGTVAVAATSFLGGMAVERLAAQSSDGRGPHGRLGFLEVPPSTDDAIVVPPGYARGMFSLLGARRCYRVRPTSMKTPRYGSRTGAAGQLQP